MNERIKQLYEQAMEQHVSNNMAWEELNPEKFAELIVQECADIALKSGNIANKNISAKIESERIYHKIMDHFGD